MPVIHIGVYSEAVVTHLCNWADTNDVGHFYVAPKEESSDRNPADHVTMQIEDLAKIGELIGCIAASGWKTEITVE